MINCF